MRRSLMAEQQMPIRQYRSSFGSFNRNGKELLASTTMDLQHPLCFINRRVVTWIRRFHGRNNAPLLYGALRSPIFQIRCRQHVAPIGFAVGRLQRDCHFKQLN